MGLDSSLEQIIPQKTTDANTTSVDLLKVSEQRNGIRSKERTDNITEQLVGKEFQTPANISILYPDKEMKKSPMILDTAKQTITYNNQTIQLSLPMGASINKVEFRSDNIIVQGKVGIFSKEGSVSYEAFMKGIDDVLVKKQTSITSANGNIDMKVV